MRAFYLASVLVLVGCGGDDDASPDTTDTGTLPADSGSDSVAVDSAKSDTGSAADTTSATDTTPATDTAPDAASDASDSDVTSDACPSTWMVAPTVDSSIAVPSGGGSLLLHAFGTGTQDYACVATTTAGDAGADAADGDAADTATTTYAWTLTGPEADLKDCAGVKIGTHFASSGGATAPEWLTLDGTNVIAAKNAQFSVDATAVPWLLLHATAHTGTGTLSKVQFIQRTNTTGGKAPATGCDASTAAGTTTKVAYTADYWFFGTP